MQGNFFNTVEENVDKLVDILEDETWRSNNIKDSQRKGYCYPWDSNLPVSSGVDSRELNKKELDKNATLEVEHSFYEKIQSIVKKVFTVKVNVTSEEKQESYLLPPILRNHTFPEYPDDILNLTINTQATNKIMLEDYPDLSGDVSIDLDTNDIGNSDVGYVYNYEDDMYYGYWDKN